MISDFVKKLVIDEENKIHIEKKLRDIHQTIRSKIPDGVADSIPRTVADDIMELSRETIPSMPWMSFSLMNDGPNGVNVIINDRSTDKAPVKRGEALDANLIAKDMIYRVFLYCETGETANIRIYALK